MDPSNGSGQEAQPIEQTFDRVLVSIGRRPNSAIPGLDRTGVTVGERGFITVDPAMRTTAANIFAIGDVVGEPMLAHKASHEAKVAVEAILGHKVAFEPQAIPAVVFTDPEVAWCGLTENEAKKQGRKVEIAKFPWAALGRALAIDRPDGLTKLVIDPETERILGVGIVGAGAGELIAEGVLAIEMAALASDLKLSIHPHPTMSETLMEAAEVFFGHSTHVYRPKRK
jgi:dihydrolipoamide dehydrogenase